MHLKREMHRHGPEAQAPDDTHDVVEEGEEGCQNSGGADIGRAPDQWEQTQPEVLVAGKGDIHTHVKETAVWKPAVHIALNECKPGLADHLQQKQVSDVPSCSV